MSGDADLRTRVRMATVAGAAGALGVAATVWLARLALDVGDVLTNAGGAAVLTTLSTAACAVLAGRLALCLLSVAVTAALPPLGRGRRGGRRVALALSPRWARPTVALLLAAGVTAGGTACSGGTLPVAVVAAASASSHGSSPPSTVPPAQVHGSGQPTQAHGSGQHEPGQARGRPHGRGSAATPVDPADPGRSPARQPASADPAGRAPQLAAPGLPDPEWQVLSGGVTAGDRRPAPRWRAPAPPPAPRLPEADAALVTSGAHRHGFRPARALQDPDDGVVVHRGDSLWRIAARSLGPGASDAEVATEWPRWWRANRSAVGPDPDLLRPGTRLMAPDERLHEHP
jgi:nucleoid-associated protein YgaU